MSCELCAGCGADVTNAETFYLCAPCEKARTSAGIALQARWLGQSPRPPATILSRIAALPEECAACTAKPGSPDLCSLCVAIRGLKHDARMVAQVPEAPEPRTTAPNAAESWRSPPASRSCGAPDRAGRHACTLRVNAHVRPGLHEEWIPSEGGRWLWEGDGSAKFVADDPALYEANREIERLRARLAAVGEEPYGVESAAEELSERIAEALREAHSAGKRER